MGRQLYGVVVIGSSQNSIGGTLSGAGNTISGNFIVGAYITRQDFNGNVYSVPANNNLFSNQLGNNGTYGVYRYEAPGNNVQQAGRFANSFTGDPISIADYIPTIGKNQFSPSPPSKFTTKSKTVHAPKAKPKKPKSHVVAKTHSPKVVARPKVPTVLHAGTKIKVVKVKPAHPAG
jgi:hypothetical protein